MNHFIIRFIVGIALVVSIVFLLLFNALLLWVAAGPRSLNELSPYIEKALEPEDHSYSIHIGETWLIWDGWKHPIDINLHNVEVITADKERFSTFPQISLGIDLWALMGGHILPTSLTISHPEFNLFQTEDHSINFGFHKEVPVTSGSQQPGEQTLPAEDLAEVPLSAIIVSLIAPDHHSQLRKLRTVTITDANVTIGNPQKSVFFNASDVQVIFKNDEHGIQASSNAHIKYADYASTISAHFTLPHGSDTIEGHIKATEVMPAVLANMFTADTILKGMQFPVNVDSTLSLDNKGILQQLHFVVDAKKGVIENDMLDGILPITSLHAQGDLSSGGKHVHLAALNVNSGGMLMDASGTLLLAGDDTTVNADIELKDIPTKDAHILWPLKVAPNARQWVTENISDGAITNAKAHINIKAGDMAHLPLPKEDIDAVMSIKGNTIRYLPDHPVMTNAQGSIHIDGSSLDANIESAQYLKQTKLTGGKLVIEDLNAENPYIKIDLDLETTAHDVVHFLDLPRLKHAKKLNLNEDTATGTMTAHASVGFSFFASHDEKAKGDEPEVAFEVKADIKDITQSGFMQKFDIQNATGNVLVNNELLEFKGAANVNGANISESDIKYWFKKNPEDPEFDTIIEATATAPTESLPRFGYPAFSFLQGTFGIKASLKSGAAKELSQASIDLAGTEINWQEAHWQKQAKEPATLDLISEKKNGIASISSFSVKAKNIDIHGSAELDKTLSSIEAVKLDKFIYGDSDLDRITYQKIANGFLLDAHGNIADLAPWLASGEDSEFSFEHFPAVQLNVSANTVLLGEERILNNVKGKVTCDVKYCANADISGVTVDNKPFQFRILHNPKGMRQLSVHAQSAGAFLKALGVFEGMEGGDLTITGGYDDSGSTSNLTAIMDIDEHTIKGAPVMAKMLSLASFTGIFDTFRGHGIAFSKLRAPFTLSNDVITFTDAKTHGAAMGMTMEGTITFPKRTLDLRGTLVPSYTLNHVLSNVPLVGNMLTGGEGEGVFAARYHITGSDSDPNVSVNPLSILTPGFLRGVFDIFDRPVKKEDAQ